MQNLAHYVQCHPSFRYLRVRHKRPVLAVFLIFCTYFLWMEWYYGGGGHGSANHRYHPNVQHSDDEVLMLRAQLGYLKNKLAKEGKGSFDTNDKAVPVIYVITPTYKRPVQKAELMRLCHTFLLVPNLHWIVVEDAKANTEAVRDLLARCGVVYTLLHEETPPEQKLAEKDKQWSKPRGVLQRNAGLHWLRDTFRNADAGSSGRHAGHGHEGLGVHLDSDGVIYFADDDNTYTLELFEEMRYTHKVSVWPVGLVGGLMVERPKVDLATGRVIGWDVTWNPSRPFALDMAGFAVNLKLFLSKPKAKFAYKVRRGFQVCTSTDNLYIH